MLKHFFDKLQFLFNNSTENPRNPNLGLPSAVLNFD